MRYSIFDIYTRYKGAGSVLDFQETTEPIRKSKAWVEKDYRRRENIGKAIKVIAIRIN